MKWTICRVLDDMIAIAQKNADGRDLCPFKKLEHLATMAKVMSKRMDGKLLEYKFSYDKDWWTQDPHSWHRDERPIDWTVGGSKHWAGVLDGKGGENTET